MACNYSVPPTQKGKCDNFFHHGTPDIRERKERSPTKKPHAIIIRKFQK